MAEKRQAANNSFWQEVELQYPDGFSFVQVLDQNMIRRLENGDKELLAQIRKNYEEIQAGTTCAATIEPTRPENEASDVEDSSPCTSTELLINLYEENENEMEDPRHKKKDIWKRITQGLQNAGFDFTQVKVEGKWRSLIASHKMLRDNKTKTGQKRKTFQYFERIDAILAKRHDVNPSFLSGSDLKSTVKTTFSTRSECSHTSSLEETSDMKKAEDSSSSDTEKNVAEISNKRLSACRRREKRKLSDSLIDVVTKIEEQRKAEREERERKKDARAKEKNEILKQFLEILKNK
ncbi:uncharacterized protein LOC144619854 isoform X2 [Crassostrea virginica]|uniref:Uncharacterized protein LOC111116629 isoform X2 n=1 Tax=Crassostrea virginica TaxID=6565 RepID=A0A8B8C994_CRAVI|nr:uncharacterized protein LOC111116629 isoform X2 [Crassostrea virginica]